MAKQTRLLLDDAESVTRRDTLGVLHARADSVATFGPHYFAGFRSLRALTYTSSMPMIAGLLAEHEFDDFECIFGHPGILPPEAADMLAFQAVVRDELEGRLFRLKIPKSERRRRLYWGIEEGKVRFFVTKDMIAHAKIYLLSTEAGSAGGPPAGGVERRVIVGSANLSERAFSGRQAETLVVFDDDDVAWRHYEAQFEAVRDASSSRIPVSDAAPMERVRIERTPALVKAEQRPEGTALFVPAPADADDGLSHQVGDREARLDDLHPHVAAGARHGDQAAPAPVRGVDPRADGHGPVPALPGAHAPAA